MQFHYISPPLAWYPYWAEASQVRTQLSSTFFPTSQYKAGLLILFSVITHKSDSNSIPNFLGKFNFRF